MFGQSQNFSGSDKKIFGQQKIFEYIKPTTFAGQSFHIQKKRLLFEVKILFRDYYFIGIKIEKTETDSK